MHVDLRRRRKARCNWNIKISHLLLVVLSELKQGCGFQTDQSAEEVLDVVVHVVAQLAVNGLKQQICRINNYLCDDARGGMLFQTCQTDTDRMKWKADNSMKWKADNSMLIGSVVFNNNTQFGTLF